VHKCPSSTTILKYIIHSTPHATTDEKTFQLVDANKPINERRKERLEMRLRETLKYTEVITKTGITATQLVPNL